MSNAGEHTEKLRTSDATTNEETVDMIEERLSNLREITNPKSEEASEIDEKDLNPDEGNQETSELDEDPNPGENEDGDGEPDKEVEDDVIPDAYIQAAIRSGWGKEEIDSTIKESPELAKKVFGNLYQGVNQLSREYAALGRAKIANTKQQNQQDKQQTDQQSKIEFEGVDLKALKDEYGDSPIVDGVVKPLSESLAKVVDKLNQVTEQFQSQPSVNTNMANFDQIDDPIIKQQVDLFFDSDIMGSYNDFYGKLEVGQDNSFLNLDQRKRRWDVIQEADAIVAGYHASGKYISVDEAMARAHMLVTEPVREQAIRESIKSTAKKRNKSMTLRPSKSTKTSSGSGKFSNNKPRNKEELVASVSEKMNNIFDN